MSSSYKTRSHVNDPLRFVTFKKAEKSAKYLRNIQQSHVMVWNIKGNDCHRYLADHRKNYAE